MRFQLALEMRRRALRDDHGGLVWIALRSCPPERWLTLREAPLQHVPCEIGM